MAIFEAPGSFERSINAAISRRIEDIITEETERAVNSVRAKIAEQKGAIAMAIFKHFDVVSMADRVVITVKDSTK